MIPILSYSYGMLYSHLEMTEEEALLRFQEDYTADINMFDRIENEALKMADYMFCGIIKNAIDNIGENRLFKFD